MRVLFELAENAALLQLHVEALEGAVDGFVGLNVDVNQICFPPPGRNGDYTTGD